MRTIPLRVLRSGDDECAVSTVHPSARNTTLSSRLLVNATSSRPPPPPFRLRETTTRVTRPKNWFAAHRTCGNYCSRDRVLTRCVHTAVLRATRASKKIHTVTITATNSRMYRTREERGLFPSRAPSPPFSVTCDARRYFFGTLSPRHIYIYTYICTYVRVYTTYARRTGYVHTYANRPCRVTRARAPQ